MWRNLQSILRFKSVSVNYFMQSRSARTKVVGTPKPLHIEEIKEAPVIKEVVEDPEKLQIANRITRQDPGVVRLGFIPDEWFMFFFNKTGVSGFGTFCTTVSTFLVSKELFVLEEEFYTGISMLCICVLAVKYLGPHVAEYADTKIDEYEESLNKSRRDEVQSLVDDIQHEKQLQWSNEGQIVLVNAKRENVDLQLEDVYRQRLMHCYKETKKRLDFHLHYEAVQKTIIQKHMIKWITKEVEASITPEVHNKAINKCIDDLIEISRKYQEPVTTGMAIKP